MLSWLRTCDRRDHPVLDLSERYVPHLAVSSRSVLAPTLETDRLILRGWSAEDIKPFLRINQDPRVTEYLSGPLDHSDVIEFARRATEHFETHGFGLWAVEPKRAVDGAPGALIGFVGLAVPRFDAHFMPSVEIGWRLAPEAWGQGFATEGGRAAVAFAFDEARLSELVSFTVPANRRSRAVMERLDMICDPADDFDHPSLPPSHPHRAHVLYRLALSAP